MENRVEALRKQRGLSQEAFARVIRGGMARYAEPFCTHPHIYDPQLLAKGLMLLYEWNVERPAPRPHDRHIFAALCHGCL